MDENRQFEIGNQHNEKALSEIGSEDERIEIIEHMLHSWPPDVYDLSYLIDTFLNEEYRKQLLNILNMPNKVYFHINREIKEKLDLLRITPEKLGDIILRKMEQFKQ